MMQFELPKERPSIIKVIGVGGGGSNAVNYMYRLGIKGVDFMVCNTDHQALDISPVPRKVQLGPSLTEGRGAGAIPEVGKNAAIENIEEIKALLKENTKMVFITAGMGGGTGTGAAPIIAGVARDMGILTVAIVTVPFNFEGRKRKAQADSGIEELKKNVDTLLIICNEKLREIHGNLKLTDAFGHADNILAIAAKSIAEIITNTLHINVDFADIQTVMKDSGVAIMGSGTAEGENRAIDAVRKALDSPLLNDNEIVGARYILLNITSGDTEVTMDEMGEITDYVQEQAGQSAEVIMGVGNNGSLGEHINVTIIATGFKTKDQAFQATSKPEEKIIYNLNDHLAKEAENKKVIAETKVVETVAMPANPMEPYLKTIAPSVIEQRNDVAAPVNNVTVQDPGSQNMGTVNSTSPPPVSVPVEENRIITSDAPSQSTEPVSTPVQPARIVHHLLSEEEISGVQPAPQSTPQPVPSVQPAEPIVEMVFEINAQKEIPVESKTEIPVQSASTANPSSPTEEDPFMKARERIFQLKAMSLKFNTPNGLNDLEKEPAYKRKNIQLENIPASNETNISRLTLTNDPDNKPEIKSNNSFLHDRVD